MKRDLLALMLAYPDAISGAERGGDGRVYVVMASGERIVYDDGREKSFEQQLAGADIQDSLSIPYPLDMIRTVAEGNSDPGRVRCYALLGALYGSTRAAVEANLRSVRTGGGHYPFNRKNGAAAALEAAITPQTCGFLVEPIQGEAGVIVPSPGYLRAVRDICTRHNIILCLDEIQTGLGRTGRLFCYEHEEIRPDIVILGKALSGGFYPVSLIACDDRIMNVFEPGTHGSTYGGNPLACAIGIAALDVILDERLSDRAAELGTYFLSKLRTLEHPRLKEVRGLGLLAAVEFTEPVAKEFCKKLQARGILAKDTHGTTVRFAPPLV
ncbi:MAG TPA: aminotransferase class III-fold pyridoxal phosphate-dependent enzyme, partial [Bryobacteraceae bacterium]|nr:aminotransferase class III-fold pyridoxal phosphate-dependent enzyme [Bryobacteraceae bacterium]